MSSKRRFAIAIFAALIAALAAARADDVKMPPRRIDITVTEKGFEPARVTVKKGEEVILAFTRKTDKTCAKDVVVHVTDKEKVEKDLPLDKVVPITLTFPKAGEVHYACGMGMYKGVIVVE